MSMPVTHEREQSREVLSQYVPTGDQLLQKLTTAIMTGTAPDVCWIHNSWVPPLSRQDAIHDLGELADTYSGFDEEVKADFFQAPLQTSYYEGKLMMMPIEGTNLALAYNRDAFRKAGLESPTYRKLQEENPAMRVFAEQMAYAYAEPVLLPEAGGSPPR